MKKVVITLAVGVAALLCWAGLRFHSFPLIDGYRLQGFSGYGTLTHGYIHPIITEPIVGLQASVRGYLFGWTNPSPEKKAFFLITTRSGVILWYSDFESYSAALRTHNLPAPEINKEINLAGLRQGAKLTIE